MKGLRHLARMGVQRSQNGKKEHETNPHCSPRRTLFFKKSLRPIGKHSFFIPLLRLGQVRFFVNLIEDFILIS